MRIKYLKSVLRQEVGFFDSQGADSSITYQVVSTLSSDANSIQAVIGEKVLVLLTPLISSTVLGKQDALPKKRNTILVLIVLCV